MSCVLRLNFILASPKLWRELCVTYAKQLEDDGCIHRAASYYLNVHKVYDAIEVLARHNQYRLVECTCCRVLVICSLNLFISITF